jgi:hypothetical protein
MFCLQIAAAKTPIVTKRRGNDINGFSSLGCTPLATAILYHRVEMLEYLLKHGANVGWGYRRRMSRGEDWTDGTMGTVCSPMHLVAGCNFEAAVRLLHKYGGKVDDEGCADTQHRNITPLHRASYETGLQLLSLAASARHRTASGWTLLLSAVETLDARMIRLHRGERASVEVLAMTEATSPILPLGNCSTH